MSGGRTPYEAAGSIIAALLLLIVVVTLLGVLARALDFMAGALGVML